jgi:signal peptidase I
MFLKEFKFYTNPGIVAIIFAIGLHLFIFALIIKISAGSMEPIVLSVDSFKIFKVEYQKV